MSVSDFDCFAMDETGTAVVDGWWRTPSGVTVAIYKHWVDLHDHRAWRELERGMVKPIVASIQEGRVRYMDITIDAIRGPQQGVFVVAIVGDEDRPTRAMVGCGVYGCDVALNYTGVTEESLKFLRDWVRAVEVLGDELFRGGDTDEEWAEKLKDPRFRAWMSEERAEAYDFPEIVRKIPIPERLCR